MVTIEIKKIGSVKNIESLKNILVALMNNLPNAKYKTELIKLCFILDYQYCKNFSKKEGPTTVEYVKYNYGPYSESFIEAFNSLKEHGIIVEVSLPFGEGYELVKKEESKEMSLEILQLIKKVVETYGTMSLREMKDYIYNLEEFKKTIFGEPIILLG